MPTARRQVVELGLRLQSVSLVVGLVGLPKEATDRSWRWYEGSSTRPAREVNASSCCPFLEIAPRRRLPVRVGRRQTVELALPLNVRARPGADRLHLSSACRIVASLRLCKDVRIAPQFLRGKVDGPPYPIIMAFLAPKGTRSAPFMSGHPLVGPCDASFE